MTLDQKLRYTGMAVAGAALALRLVGVHVLPLDIAGSSGSD